MNAIIQIHGILTKTSYEEIHQQISSALTKHQRIILDINSPGGETSGLFDLADFIYQARNKIWAICNDEAYSAAYAIASSAEKVFINRTSGVGSIGVIATHIDQSAFDQMLGIKYTTVFAGNRKNDLNPHEAISSESIETLQKEVNRLYEMFVSLVARNRNLTLEAVRATEGGLYFGTDAIEIGLADEVLSLPECIKKAAKQKMTETDELLAKGRSEYHAEALEIFRLCKLSKMPEKLGDFIEQNISIDNAREQLMELLANKSANIINTLDTNQENPVIQAAKARRKNDSCY